MTEKEEKNANEEDEERRVRHTISAEETFTLAKDVFDLRCFFMNLYKNRAVIAHRFNIISLVCSLVFTLIFASYTVWSVVCGKLSLGLEITVYILLGVYVLLAAVLLTVGLCSGNANTKTLKRYKKTLKIFRLALRLVSIVMAIVSIVLSSLDAVNAADLALQVILIILSIIVIVIQSVLLIFGGIVNLVRWSNSPAKGRKVRFSKVILEWYEEVCGGADITKKDSAKNISPKYIEDIGRCIDGYIIPRMGKMRVSEINAAAIYSAADNYTADKSLIEGIFKSVFAYAEECGYINANPVKDLGLEGSIEEKKKPEAKEKKNRISSWLGRKARSAVDSFLSGDQNK